VRNSAYRWGKLVRKTTSEAGPARALTWKEVLRLGEGDGPGFIARPFLTLNRDKFRAFWLESGWGGSSV
jgi:hypothetical protein